MNDVSTAQHEVDPDALSRLRQLVRRAQDGDRGALETLARRYQRGLRAMVRRSLGDRLRRHLESMDVVQETFAQAMGAIDTLEVRREDSVSRWLGKIALRVIYGYDRHFHAIKRESLREQPLEDPPVERRAGPGTVVGDREEFGLYLRALSRLPSRERELVRLRQREGLPWEDVARHTGYPSGDAARMCLQRVKQELRRAVGFV